MKCGIVTVYNSENCGSFLQAYALSRALQKLGHESVFIRQQFGGHSASKRNFLIKLIKTVLKGNIPGAKRLVARRAAFRRATDSFLTVVDEKTALDAYFLGSDVIWDVTVPLFRNHYPFFFGTQFQNGRVISYAPAVGFAKAEDIKNCDFIAGALKEMKAVSVRDKTSKALVQPYCDKEIEVVCDPTYLLDRSDYEQIAKPVDLKDFLFLYAYGKMPADYKEAIRAFAKKKGLKIVTFGNLNPWCDVSLPYDPLTFLSIYAQAEYILTNTFHGTVFATIYEKRFAVLKNDKPKILDLLDTCGMADKMTGKAADVETVLESEFRYDVTRANIAKEREHAMQYLNQALKGM